MSDSVLQPQAAAMGESRTSPEVRQTYRRIAWRLLPFLFLAYAVNSIDRINISFAKLRMARDLGLSDTAYAFGATAFFVGYILFEIPGNLYMQRVGARATLTRIMVLWGMVTALTCFVNTPARLYIARFALGVAEAGFFPGVILYLTYWFPSWKRGRVTAIFFMSGFVAGMVSGPLAGAIMTGLEGWYDMKGWQVLFVLEGLPAIALGVFAWFWLDDSPSHVTWLTDRQKVIVAEYLRLDQDSRTHESQSFGLVVRDPRAYVPGIVFFALYSGTNTVAYWMPSLLQEGGITDLHRIGLIASGPYLLALASMYLLGRSSDRRLERRWHLAATMLTSAVSFGLMHVLQANVLLSTVFMTIGAAACLAAVPLFWTIPPAFFSARAAAGGIALVSSIGSLAAVLSPITVAAIKARTGSLYVAFDVIGCMLLIGTVALLAGIPAARLRERQ
ncbi:MFS transporter, ACS family, phthalate transporter [Paraburkholderia tuberum]|uniref:MFS transporter, ACS family, phthalate transporter n=2 Tax=Paraburkholderia tuberum TaxID=157910 RepID=A0A1H1KFJ9_9BURK|nr:MFS transporter, ACS family, phthalate transporter [Paraburkholderia tuberum]